MRAFGIAVSAVSVAAVVWWALHQEPPRLPEGAGQIGALGAAVAVYALNMLLRGERWHALLARRGANAARADCQALNLVGYMGNSVLPARGGDVLRVSLLGPRSDAGARTVIGTLVAERVLDVLTLLLLFVVVGYGLLHGVDVPGGARVAAVLGGAAGLVLLAAGALRLARGHAWGRRLGGFLVPIAASTRDLRGRHGAAMVAVTIAIWLVEASVWYLVSLAADIGISPLEALYLVALASVFLLVPAGPGYAGTLDAAVVFGVKALGGSGSEAVSYLLLLRFVLLVPVTVGGLGALVARYGWPGRALEAAGR